MWVIAQYAIVLVVYFAIVAVVLWAFMGPSDE